MTIFYQHQVSQSVGIFIIKNPIEQNITTILVAVNTVFLLNLFIKTSIKKFPSKSATAPAIELK